MKLDQAVYHANANKPFKLEGHTTFAGMKIAIENKKGSTRSGVGANGRAWSVTMPYDYGYIKKSVGKDGDEVDCFIGPDKAAKFAYVIHQCKEADRKQYDEDKVMLGFGSADAALRAYRSAFNGPDLYTGMTVLPMTTFKQKMKKKNTKSKIHAYQDGTGTDDYRQFREGTSIQPLTNNHPPSLKNPQKVSPDNPDDKEDKLKDKKKRRSKATRDFYKELARRQVDKPTIAETTQFVPMNQG